MRAYVYKRYGGADVLRLADIPTPVPGPGEVLVKVGAVSFNSSDREFLTGSPVYARVPGLFRPRTPVLGSDIAGTIVATGSGVSAFSAGDAVFGDLLFTWGGFAEYVLAPVDRIVRRPPSISEVVAASLPQAAVVALQGLEWGGPPPGPGSRVLINGAGGGSGTFAVRIARSWGATVTGVDRAVKTEAMREAGCDTVVDFEHTDPTRIPGHFDRILDLHGTRPLRAWRRRLEPDGVYALAGGALASIVRAAFGGPVRSRFDRARMGMVLVRTMEGIDRIIAMVDSGAIVPRIEHYGSFEDLPAAMERFCSGSTTGKTVITVH